MDVNLVIIIKRFAMEQYNEFARVYDMFMDNIPYEEWSEYIIDILNEYGINDGLCLDLGCGTGKLTNILSDKGFDMIGVDNSEEMLNVAMDERQDRDILYLCQDMREFELFGTVKSVISICDSINYITDSDDLLSVFKLVNNYLDPGGIFIFDINTYYKYSEILGETTIAENRDEASFIWENYFDEESNINEYALTLFIKEEELFRKYEELHYQRAYHLEEIKELIKEAGLEFVAMYDSFSREEPTKTSERVHFVCREKGKKG